MWPQKQLLAQVERIFQTNSLKPTYSRVRLTNNTLATVPVFDIKSMILLMVHDKSLMNKENFAVRLDDFTGNVHTTCNQNNLCGEIHTGDATEPAREKFCGRDGKYMPFGIIIFGNKSHTDLHGSLSVTPITFTATFFNCKARNNQAFWKLIACLPNLAYGKGQGLTPKKVQDEHNCLAYTLKSLVNLSELGGIQTKVMGREGHLKMWIHFFIGDTEGHNKWIGHYNASTNVQRPYQDCHCTFDELESTNPRCIWMTANEYCRAVWLAAFDKKAGMQMFQSMSRHCLTNALFQPNLPLWDTKHGANQMQPPEMLHTSDSGLITYMFESLQGLLLGGKQKMSSTHSMYEFPM